MSNSENKKHVKLSFYRREPKLVTVDSYEAKAWDAFSIIHIEDQNLINEELLNNISNTLNEKNPDNVHIFVSGSIDDIEVYGVEVIDE